ncbi:hypothetical protein [Oscillibacter sp.]|uniref:hypothetical protein n=1 Tax=Oscillibacter sp. TaxID=1945593 RepID=UPI00257BF712|nr:hypothetical protein [Oscillibacter sp.]
MGLDGEGVAVQLQLDVLLLEAGQVGLQLVVVAFIGDVGFELRQTAAGEEVVVERRRSISSISEKGFQVLIEFLR